MKVRRVAALTLVEVLVALALLAIVSTAILGTFSLMARLNQSSSTDVDYSRVVRSVMERTRLDWSLPSEWQSEHVGGEPINDYVLGQSDGACSARIIPDSVVPDDVRVVRVTCEASGGLQEQAFDLEFGRP